MPIAVGDALALTRELVRVDSRNPSLVPGGPGEHAVAHQAGNAAQENSQGNGESGPFARQVTLPGLCIFGGRGHC